MTSAEARYQEAVAQYNGTLVQALYEVADVVLNNQRALVNLQSRAFSLDLALIHALGGGFETTES
ncbi:Outer membrane component of tripartite multidrug resistance system [Vibrio cholerae]|nr:Outer membrane component of tripartite multidrug resistance system [Vibrio cholerae]